MRSEHSKLTGRSAVGQKHKKQGHQSQVRAVPGDRQAVAAESGRLEDVYVARVLRLRRLRAVAAAVLALTLLPRFADAQTEVLAQCRCADGSLTPIHCDVATCVKRDATTNECVRVNGNWYESAVCNEWCAERGGVDNNGWLGYVRSALEYRGAFRTCDIAPAGAQNDAGDPLGCICIDGFVRDGCGASADPTSNVDVCFAACGAVGQLPQQMTDPTTNQCQRSQPDQPRRADACHCDTNPPSSTVWCISSEGFETDAELSAACGKFCEAEFGVGVHHSEPDSTRCLWLPPDQPAEPQRTTTTEPIVTTTTIVESGCDNDLPGILDDLRCLVGLLP